MDDIQKSLENFIKIDDLGNLKNGKFYIDKEFNRDKIYTTLKILQSLLANGNNLTVVIIDEGSESKSDNAIVKPSNDSIEDVKKKMLSGANIDGHVYKNYESRLKNFIHNNNLKIKESYANNDLVSVSFTKMEPINQEIKESFKKKILDHNGYNDDNLSKSEKSNYVEYESKKYKLSYYIHKSINDDDKENEINKYIIDNSYDNELTIEGGKRKTSRNQKKSRKARKSRRKSNRRRGRR